jgi:hypothetical protein
MNKNAKTKIAKLVSDMLKHTYSIISCAGTICGIFWKSKLNENEGPRHGVALHNTPDAIVGTCHDMSLQSPTEEKTSPTTSAMAFPYIHQQKI